MRELLIATTNKDKLFELREGLGDVPFSILTLKDVGVTTYVEETASTFEGNALIKAFMYGKLTGKLVLAEDTGLEVDALDGRPGVFSARYAENDEARNKKMLMELSGVPLEKRTARFRVAIAIYDPERGDKVRTCEAKCEGRIAEEARGSDWGYNTIFDYESRGKTGGEMTFEEKRKYSHRARAAAKARELLLSDFV